MTGYQYALICKNMLHKRNNVCMCEMLKKKNIECIMFAIYVCDVRGVLVVECLYSTENSPRRGQYKIPVRHFGYFDLSSSYDKTSWHPKSCASCCLCARIVENAC